ncbi:hypothetical protein ACFIJ5_04960 [Haloimpatiens sp. FM7330]|uniref:hypothetical protein n=1 Tax=Haloimpatiens sp. FM7330 TaxID=3298610 RepID=UPI003643417F
MGEELTKLREALENIVRIRELLIRLKTCPKELIFYEENVVPLLFTMYYLSFVSANLSREVSNLYNVNLSRNSKIKESIELIYEINDVLECMLPELERQIKILLKIYD